MALHKVEEVFVGNTVVLKLYLMVQIPLLKLWPMLTGVLVIGVLLMQRHQCLIKFKCLATPTAPTWPDAIKFMFYDALRIARFSQRIEMVL